MNRSQRIAIWVLTLIGLLAAWKLFGQGFGGFRGDQPFLARNYSASSPCVQSCVTNIANLAYWFIADSNTFYTTTFTEPSTNTGKVKGWQDLSGNGNHVANHFNSGSGDDAKSPVLLTNFVNGHNAIDFNGYSGGSLDKVRAGALPVTIFIVWKARETGFAYLFGSTTADSALLAMASGIGNQADSSKRLGGYAAPTVDFIVFSAVLNGASSKSYTNGVVCDDGSGKDLTGVVSDGLRLGDNSYGNAGLDQPGKYYLAEFIYYEAALGDTDRQTVQCYLAAKYGITLP